MYRNESNVQHATPRQQSVPQDQTYFVRHNFDGPARITTTIAHAISDVTGVDVTDSEFTLHNHVDPDALDSLFKPRDDGTPRMNGHLTFNVWGYQVTVYSDGQIAIVPPRQPQSPGR